MPEYTMHGHRYNDQSKVKAQIEMKYKLIVFLMYSLQDFFEKCLKSSPVVLSAGAGMMRFIGRGWKEQVLPTPGKGFSSNKGKNFGQRKKGGGKCLTFSTKKLKEAFMYPYEVEMSS